MHAAVLTKPDTIEFQEVDEGVCQAQELLIKVAYCGICGSDIPRVFEGTSRSYPNILGHEFSGTVVQVGDKVNPSLIGSRVAGIPLIPCRSCDACKQGNFALCENYDFIGSRRFGALAEYVIVPATNIYPLDDSVGFLEASFFEPASVAMHAINLTPFKPGSRVAIMGCGTIGVFLAQILKYLGASKVVAIGRRESRLELARACGIADTVNTSLEGWKDVLFALSEGNGFDLVFETSGNAKCMSDSYSVAAIKACICMVGTPKTDLVFSVSQWEELNRKELSVVGSWMSYSSPFPGEEWKTVAQMFASGVFGPIESLIDTIYPLNEAAEAFARFANHQSVDGKIVIQCSE